MKFLALLSLIIVGVLLMPRFNRTLNRALDSRIQRVAAALFANLYAMARNEEAMRVVMGRVQ